MLAINLPADGLFLAILNRTKGDLSEDNCKHAISEYIDRFLEAKPDVILLNACYRRSLTPSEIFDSYLYDIETDENGFAKKNEKGEIIKTVSPSTENVSKYFTSFFVGARELMKRGIDIYKFAIERIKETDCRVFLSVRMNDAHYTKIPAINSSFALKNGGQHTIDRDGVNLDYSQEAVRNYYYSYIEELLRTYDVDGIEVDWLRYPTVLPPERCSEFHIINEYMKKIRRLVNTYNESAEISVRMLSTEKENLQKGFDVCQWVEDGSIDMITVSNFHVPTNYEIPISEWKKNIDKRNVSKNSYKLLCGSDWAVSCVKYYRITMNPALVRGFVGRCLDEGADGVYLFNYFEENDTSSFELVSDEKGGVRLENCFMERMKAAHCPDGLPRRYPHAGDKGRYPISLSPDGAYVFTKTIKRPFEKCKIVIGCDKDEPLSVTVNGIFSVKAEENDLVFSGYEYIPPEEIGKKNHFIYALSQAAPFVRSVWLPADILVDGALKAEIKNASPGEINLLWLEVVCE